MILLVEIGSGDVRYCMFKGKIIILGKTCDNHGLDKTVLICRGVTYEYTGKTM